MDPLSPGNDNTQLTPPAPTVEIKTDGKEPLSPAAQQTLTAFRQELLVTGYSPKTIKMYLIYAQKFWNTHARHRKR